MALTDAQLATLKTDIYADPELVALISDPNDDAHCYPIADIYNTETASYWVWKNEVTPEEYRSVITWSEVDTMNNGDARIWEWITANMTLSYNANDANVRQGLNDAWATSPTSKAALIDISKRLATRVEELFATGTGTNASPASMVVIGPISFQDVCKAIRLQ